MPASPRTKAGRALHDWWHQIGLLMLDAAQDHDHPEGCNFVGMVLAIEAEAAQEAAPLDVPTLAEALLEAENDGQFGPDYNPTAAAFAISDAYARLAPVRPADTCQVRPTGQEWREPCGLPMPCAVRAALAQRPTPAEGE